MGTFIACRIRRLEIARLHSFGEFVRSSGIQAPSILLHVGIHPWVCHFMVKRWLLASGNLLMCLSYHQKVKLFPRIPYQNWVTLLPLDEWPGKQVSGFFSLLKWDVDKEKRNWEWLMSPPKSQPQEAQGIAIRGLLELSRWWLSCPLNLQGSTPCP